mgnify:CR=1 FL=1
MGRKIKINFEDKWQVWSSVTDSVIYECSSKNNLLYFLAKEAEYDGKLKAIKELLQPLNGWMVNNSIQFRENNEYYKWLKNIQETDNLKEYYNKIDDKYTELLSSLNVNKT